LEFNREPDLPGTHYSHYHIRINDDPTSFIMSEIALDTLLEKERSKYSRMGQIINEEITSLLGPSGYSLRYEWSLDYPARPGEPSHYVVIRLMEDVDEEVRRRLAYNIRQRFLEEEIPFDVVVAGRDYRFPVVPGEAGRLCRLIDRAVRSLEVARALLEQRYYPESADYSYSAAWEALTAYAGAAAGKRVRVGMRVLWQIIGMLLKVGDNPVEGIVRLREYVVTHNFGTGMVGREDAEEAYRIASEIVEWAIRRLEELGVGCEAR